jgi:hypothetical protein
VCKKNIVIVCVFRFLISFVMLNGCRARTHWVEMWNVIFWYFQFHSGWFVTDIMQRYDNNIKV